MSVLCVTGTSTDVGKTVTTAAVAAVAGAAGLRVAVCKPAQTGVADDEPGDLAEITRLAGPGIDTLELARYPEPLAPDTAARRSGRPLLSLLDVVAAVRELDATHDLTLVEGAGGATHAGRHSLDLVRRTEQLALELLLERQRFCRRHAPGSLEQRLAAAGRVGRAGGDLGGELAGRGERVGGRRRLV